ncbi:MAG: C-terminal helicase domain-containing protein, partial [Chthonomonadales bacterium]
TDTQKQDYEVAVKSYRAARAAKVRGQVDIESCRALSPHSFEGKSDIDAAKAVTAHLGLYRDSAFNRITNLHPEGAKINHVVDFLSKHKNEPTVIFAHNVDAVKMMREKLSAEGHRVASITGNMNGDAKDKARIAFSPPSGEATADVLVCSDAGSASANLQRGYHMINYDTPMTATTHEQRIAREVRMGQKNRVDVHNLVADNGFDIRNNHRLENKTELRDLVTSPSEMIDDSGLAHRIESARARKFEQQWSKAA